METECKSTEMCWTNKSEGKKKKKKSNKQHKPQK